MDSRAAAAAHALAVVSQFEFSAPNPARFALVM
jgi:hypothetical protein